MSRAFVDSAGLDADAVGDVLVRLTQDVDAGARIQAIRALGTYHNPRFAVKIAPLLDDPAPNVQVQAAMTLGDLGGGEGVPALVRVLAGTKGNFARRKEALLSLARLDSAAFRAQAGGWGSGTDWRQRAAAAEGWARADPRGVAPFLKDADARVVAAGLQAWGEALTAVTPEYATACRQLARHRDAAVRSVAADGLARLANPADLPLLIQLVRSAEHDSFPEARLSALNGLVALVREAPDRANAEAGALSQIGVPGDYITRRWAEENWPAAAERWGAPYPLETGRSMEDYRDLVRQFVAGGDSTRYPTVTMEIADLGTVELELFGPEAPVTVASFLRLVARRYFDGQRFHRVVPNFVVQTGDPRGDGWGGPGGAIRDEINRRRYGPYFVGMALSGPDTGGSQWFITLSPQPHLDGTYTIFGRVTDGFPVLQRVTQGDLIRSIHR
jgi:cyclophilin family peptidyl-prolyl cis-trans isomerase/HEAT repeat protein